MENPNVSVSSLSDSFGNLSLRRSGNPSSSSSSSSSLAANAPPFLPSGSFLRRTLAPGGFQNQRVKDSIYDNVIGGGIQDNEGIHRLIGIMVREDGGKQFQYVLDRSNDDMLREMTSWLTSDRRVFFELSRNRIGSSSVRKLLGKIISRSGHVDSQIFSAVCDLFLPLTTAKYGRYVALETLAGADRRGKLVLHHLTEAHALDLARDPHGCSSLNDLINEIKGQCRDRILDLISSHALWLAQDSYGNFVVQHVLSLQNPIYTEKIARLLHGGYVQLSFKKHGSYVVERCLESTAMVYPMDELLRSNQIGRLAKNEFGNYVMQRALRVTRQRDPNLFARLVAKLNPYVGLLQRGIGCNTLKLVLDLAGNDVEQL